MKLCPNDVFICNNLSQYLASDVLPWRTREVSKAFSHKRKDRGWHERHEYQDTVFQCPFAPQCFPTKKVLITAVIVIKLDGGASGAGGWATPLGLAETSARC